MKRAATLPSRKKYGHFFSWTRTFLRLLFPAYRVTSITAAESPTVYVAHHQNLYGPFVILLWFPGFVRTWILSVFLERESCFRQYADYTFSERFGLNKTAAKAVAYPLSFIIPRLLESGKGIPVYRGSRKILLTMNLSTAALMDGESILIFPDIEYHDSAADIKEIYYGFLQLDRHYFKATGDHLAFTPLYVSRNQRIIASGQPVKFKSDIGFHLDKERVCSDIVDQLNQLARDCGDYR
ncbi:glycerol acyltransferase [Indiicoccus explosivorum]|uniref:glycerol acyltransferase n=1 Tax=Indiicoccus explosivorum TaxID=1917864 RepID=UPI000B453D2F|nr:glycerol acyltransferase [Indiicoccus explosivorum]